jgi:threonine/homoserine/homoserine lactone efflux protein
MKGREPGFGNSIVMGDFKNDSFKIFKHGFATGLLLQLAIGPVFFLIANLTLQKSIADGLVAVFAVTIVDYLYIALSIAGIGKLLKIKTAKAIFGIASSIVLIVFGAIIIKGITINCQSSANVIESTSLLTSFLSVFFLTISNPITIVFFTSIFTAKAVEYNYTKRDLILFGIAVGSATFIFMDFSVLLFSLLKQHVPIVLIQVLNLFVGIVLIGYGGMRITKILKTIRQE